MDLSTIKDEDYYAYLKEMFNTQGWQVMLAEMEANVALIDDLQNVSNEKDLYFKQGQLASIGVMLNFQATIKRAEEEEALDEGS